MGEAEARAVRGFFEAWTAGDLGAMLDVAHDEVEARPLLGLLYGRSDYRGHEGLTEWFRDSRGLGERFEVHVEDVRSTGDAEVAFVHVLVREEDARELDARIAVICRFRDGRLASLVGRDADEAIEALQNSAVA